MGPLLQKLLGKRAVRFRRIAPILTDGDGKQRVADRKPDNSRAVQGHGPPSVAGRGAARVLGDTHVESETHADDRSELRRVHERLRQTQFELMRQEKLSMLGQLVAGVAHEVNTPTGAILNASTDASRRLREFLTLVMDPVALPDDTRRWLAPLLDRLFREGAVRSDMAIRNERRQLEAQLREAGHAEARRLAELIVAYGKLGSFHDEAFIERLLAGPCMTVLEHVLALKASAEISESSARKIARIVHSLRLYNHSGEGGLVDVDVNESIDSMLVVMQNKIKHVAQVETHYAPDLPLVQCGADLLQVWTNILSNACDAIDLSRNGQLGLIDIVTGMAGEHVSVKISNSGPPILPEHMKRLFTPFLTTKGLGKGTGLGLSICAGIVKRYGGTITAANEPGRVIFEVRLPGGSGRASAEAAGRQGAGKVATESPRHGG